MPAVHTPEDGGVAAQMPALEQEDDQGDTVLADEGRGELHTIAMVRGVEGELGMSVRLSQAHLPIVDRVVPGGPAEACGVRVNDVIHAVDERRLTVSDYTTLPSMLPKGSRAAFELTIARRP